MTDSIKRSAVSSLPTSFDDGIRFFESRPNVSSEITVVLLHGLGNSLSFWSRVAPVVGESFHTIALDIPGFGQSRLPRKNFSLESVTEETLAFLDARGVKSAKLVGHSLGGIISLAMAEARPDLVRSLVLIDGTLITANEVLVSLRAAVRQPVLTFCVAAQFAGGLFPINSLIIDILAKSSLIRTVALWPFIHSPRAVDITTLRDVLAGNGGVTVLRALLAARGVRTKELMLRVKQPVELLWGDEDRVITDSDVEATRDLLNVTREKNIIHCGHWPLVEFPHIVSDYLLVNEEVSEDGHPFDH